MGNDSAAASAIAADCYADAAARLAAFCPETGFLLAIAKAVAEWQRVIALSSRPDHARLAALSMLERALVYHAAFLNESRAGTGAGEEGR